MPSEIRTVVDDVIDETADELLKSQEWRRRLEESHPGIDPESDEAWNWDVGAEFRISIKKPELQGLRP
ncbi:MAG: hypothetical protein Q3X95_03300 [Duodenibacillus sp.]|nr:hypothetical protein [Duodenibacillus sp.]